MKKKSALQTTEKNQTVSPKSKLRENAEAIVIAIVLALFIRAFVVQAFKIPSGSMKDTLLIGDHILVNKFIYGVTLPFVGTRIIPVSDPQRGDIIVFRYPEDPDKDFIKRLIAVPGDTVEIRAGSDGARLLILAGKPIREPIVQYGPFVMNSREEIEQAISDYRSGALVRAAAA